MTAIESDIFLEVLSQGEGSDVYSVRKRIRDRFLGCPDLGTDPDSQAVRLLCLKLQGLRNRDATFEVPRKVNAMVAVIARRYWEGRQLFGVPGSQMSDWEYGLERFADMCIYEPGRV